MTTTILIPARINSSRFPEKMIQDLNGTSLIRRVYNKCCETGYDTYVLTDSYKIHDLIPNGKCLFTKDSHENGTSRCMEIINNILHYDKYINVQGDMPDISKKIIYEVEKLLDFYDVSTVYTEMNFEDRKNSNVVKMIHNTKYAHWFLRNSIDYGDRHLGVYGYKSTSKVFFEKSVKYVEETIEDLEQLRWIQNDVKIGVSKVNFTGIEINTFQDLLKWKSLDNQT